MKQTEDSIKYNIKVTVIIRLRKKCISCTKRQKMVLPTSNITNKLASCILGHAALRGND